tara:strand:- start:4 stop:552 length:549 start_codon:yes stop_codon:yes gene_type:complete
MKVYFIRHAEGQHNVEENYSIFDPQLTSKGIIQCNKVKDQLNKIDFDKIYVSPLLRTIQTYLNIVQCKDVEISDLIREVVVNPCDYRHSKLFLENKYKMLNFSNLNDTKSVNNVESSAMINNRCNLFFNILNDLSYKNILVVSHGEFLKQFLNRFHKELEIENISWFNNCEIRIGQLFNNTL